jgi:hypothetical protein
MALELKMLPLVLRCGSEQKPHRTLYVNPQKPREIEEI